MLGVAYWIFTIEPASSNMEMGEWLGRRLPLLILPYKIVPF